MTSLNLSYNTIVPQKDPRVYSHNAQIEGKFFVQVATSFVNLHNNVDRFCAIYTKIFPFVRLHKKHRQICAGCQNIFLHFAQKMRAMWKIFVQVAQKSGFSSCCTKIGIFERNFCASCTKQNSARDVPPRADESKISFVHFAQKKINKKANPKAHFFVKGEHYYQQQKPRRNFRKRIPPERT